LARGGAEKAAANAGPGRGSGTESDRQFQPLIGARAGKMAPDVVGMAKPRFGSGKGKQMPRIKRTETCAATMSALH
jgi:hypothetical protein